MAEVSILEVLPDGKAIVTTENRFRVMIAETGEILDELVSERRSKSFVAMYNESHSTPRAQAVAIPYSELVGPCVPAGE
ncbi:hypothetical protein [Lacipirellula sp.]|uniref:hypothetical protein n=1 Tax=Lacipirellula sp. TaxID=2691419 RepID=UPI003D111AE5